MNSSSELTPNSVRSLCSELGFPLAQDKAEALCVYLSLIQKWNKVMNLVGPSRWEDVVRILIVDSLHLAEFLPELGLAAAPECWDLGAGAGLPGIPLRILRQEGRYSLVEVREKRALFLKTVLSSIPLPGVSVFRGRVEEFMPSRPPADLIVSRAFMPWRKMLELVGPYTRPGGSVVFLSLEGSAGPVPDGWTVRAEKMYKACGDERFFRAFSRGGSVSADPR